MELFQILDCSSAIGACCTDYSLVTVLDITRKIFELIQIIVPIVLVVAGTIQFVQLTINPDLKDGFRKVLNKLMAALIVFMLPTLADVVLNVVSEDVNVASCWQQAKVASSEIGFNSGNYVSTESDRNSVWLTPIQFNKTRRRTEGGGSGSVSSKQQQVVAYASKFVGKPYLYGGSWNGEEPYTATDCSGFVKGVFHHVAGVNLPHGTSLLWNNKNLYTLVSENNIQPGDVVMYDGHVGILTGNGNEMIHAAGKKWGVIKSSNYKSSSSHRILGIIRIKGV